MFSTSTAAVQAELTSPKVGWRAELSTIEEDVSGSVAIVDEDTVRIDDFTYNGGGISVYFYLGSSDTASAFRSGLRIGPQLLGTTFDGSQAPLIIDLPAGETLEGWQAISVWCEVAGVSFGSGEFAAPPLSPVISTTMAVSTRPTTPCGAMALGSTYTCTMDYDTWKRPFRKCIRRLGVGRRQRFRNAACRGECPGAWRDGAVSDCDRNPWMGWFGSQWQAASLSAADASPVAKSPRRPVRRCGCGCSLPAAGRRFCRRRFRRWGRCGRP